MTRTIVITGASDGIGAASARQLAAAGERVVVIGRDPGKTDAVARELGADSFVCDFGELAQVRSLAAKLLDRYERIDVLANNAGGIFGERRLTVDGFETTFQVNHLAPFLLTNLLLDRLAASRASVIQTASEAARLFSRFDIDDLQGGHRYAPRAAYGNAKLANILFTLELQRRFGHEGIAPVSFHPGVIASSFAKSTSGALRWFYSSPLTQRFLESNDTGGSRLTWLALGAPGIDWRPGAYYVRNREGRLSRIARDPVVAKLLWDRSAVMAGL